jgi:hypothetical protein
MLNEWRAGRVRVGLSPPREGSAPVLYRREELHPPSWGQISGSWGDEMERCEPRRSARATAQCDLCSAQRLARWNPLLPGSDIWRNHWHHSWDVPRGSPFWFSDDTWPSVLLVPRHSARRADLIAELQHRGAPRSALANRAAPRSALANRAAPRSALARHDLTLEFGSTEWLRGLPAVTAALHERLSVRNFPRCNLVGGWMPKLLVPIRWMEASRRLAPGSAWPAESLQAIVESRLSFENEARKFGVLGSRESLHTYHRHLCEVLSLLRGHLRLAVLASLILCHYTIPCRCAPCGLLLCNPSA